MMGMTAGLQVAMGQNQPMMMAAPPQGPAVAQARAATRTTQSRR